MRRVLLFDERNERREDAELARTPHGPLPDPWSVCDDFYGIRAHEVRVLLIRAHEERVVLMVRILVDTRRQLWAGYALTRVTMGFFDGSANCRVQAELRSKTFGTSDFGTVATIIHSGTDVNDFTSAPGAVTLTKTASVSLNVPPNLIVWINATVAQNATGGGDCRYSGALIDYTTTHP